MYYVKANSEVRRVLNGFVEVFLPVSGRWVQTHEDRTDLADFIKVETPHELIMDHYGLLPMSIYTAFLLHFNS